MESNGLIPETQHDFRAKISTLTAWAQIQQDWANNSSIINYFWYEAYALTGWELGLGEPVV